MAYVGSVGWECGEGLSLFGRGAVEAVGRVVRDWSCPGVKCPRIG
jgi:hypothetical protein